MQPKGTFTRPDADTGEEVVCKTIAARLGEFRAAYPTVGGWQVIRKAEISPIALPNANGAPVPCVLFVASLLRDDRVMATASTLHPIEANKSWETGETNSLSRLMEMLGFGRELTDLDERAQRQSMQSVPALAKPALKVVPTEPDSTGNTSQAQATPAAVESPARAESAKPGFVATVPAVKPKPSTKGQASIDELGIRVALKNQVLQRAAIMNIPVPEFSSIEQFEQFRLQVFKPATSKEPQQ